MKSKKIIAGALSASILVLSSGSGFASDIENIKPIHDVDGGKGIIPISSELNEIEGAYFHSFTGNVKEIRDFEGVEGAKFVTVENEEEQIATMLLSKDTYILGDAEIEIGSTVTGYYDANAPMLLIYPPQYNVEVLAIKEENEKLQSIKVDLFDDNLISADHTLKINPSDDIKIISKSGEKFDGDLSNKKLAVVYSFSTKSIPAQTTPTKIIVLSEGEIEEKEEGAVITSYDVSTMDIIVDNNKIEAPSAYKNPGGEVMVPLREIAEALGFDISWEAETQSVRLGKGIVLTIGEKNYNYMKTTPIQLKSPPESIEGVTFVPLNFFREVVGMNNAYVFEAQIVIDDGEIMQ